MTTQLEQAWELAAETGVDMKHVTVRNQRGELIAVFRGRSYTMKGRQTVALPQH